MESDILEIYKENDLFENISQKKADSDIKYENECKLYLITLHTTQNY